MENSNYLQENTNLQIIGNATKYPKSVLLKESNQIDHHDSNNLSPNQKNSFSGLKDINYIQPPNLKADYPILKEELENDVSMLSIGNELPDFKYFLPSSEKLKSDEGAKIFAEDAIKRRLINRELTIPQIKSNIEQIERITFDCDTGSVLILEIIDYMEDLELRSSPLGSNFLDETTVTTKMRMEVVNWLFRMSRKLCIDRHSVYSGMVILDRYVKAKGSSFNSKAYKISAVMCMYIACKWDLVEYPAIDDICSILKIKDHRLLHKYEIDIVENIDFNLGLPTPILFLRPMSLIKERQMVSHQVAKCLIEVCLIHYDLAGHPAHIIAAASYCLTMYMTFRCQTLTEAWTPLVQFVIGLDIEDIRPVVASLSKVLLDTDFEKEMPYVFLEYSSHFQIINLRSVDLNRVISESSQ